MQILLVNRFFGDEQVPTGRMLRDVAERLVCEGHDVRVLTSNGGYVDSERGGSGDDESMDVITLPCPSVLPKSLQWGIFLLLSWVLVPLLEWDRCVLMTDPPFLVFASYTSYLAGGEARDMYWWTMDLYPEALAAKGLIENGGRLESILRRINELSIRHLSGVVALGERQKKRLEEYSEWTDGDHFSKVVPPWDYRSIPRVKAKENRFLQKYDLDPYRVVLYAGNLGEAHSYEEALEAATQLEREKADWRFVFVVRGTRRSALEAQSRSLNNVVVLDYQPPELTADLLWAADVHLITMQPGWEGIVVPSKLYGTFHTAAPVLFIGPTNADTAVEIQRHDAGHVLGNGVSGSEFASAIEHLEKKEGNTDIVEKKPTQVANFIMMEEPTAPREEAASTVSTADQPHSNKGRVDRTQIIS